MDAERAVAATTDFPIRTARGDAAAELSAHQRRIRPASSERESRLAGDNPEPHHGESRTAPDCTTPKPADRETAVGSLTARDWSSATL